MSQALKRMVEELTAKGGTECRPLETGVAGLTAMRSSVPTALQKMIYHPLLCLVLQGTKQVLAGEEVFDFGEGQSLVVSFDLPVLGRVVQASPQAPYLALALDLDLGLMREIIEQLGPVPQVVPEPIADSGRDAPTIFVQEADEALLDSLARLTELTRRPQAIPILRDPILREVHYWLLTGRHGAAIRGLIRPDGAIHRIARAIALLRSEFTRTVRVERLAQAAGMSPSAFHQHFKAATSMTPLQYQKHLRLLEARRLMMTGAVSAARAAYQVGYESASQFSREYARMFGAPPRRDLAALASLAA